MPESIVLGELRRLYEGNNRILSDLMDNLERETKAALDGLAHIDRVAFRVKDAKSFVSKALDPANDPAYKEPLVEIEDQVAGRIVVFFLDDIDKVRQRLSGTYTFIESSRRRPTRDEEFGYESHHLICLIPPHVVPEGWVGKDELPRTFELQIRTLFMHAWAEPQHELEYKASADLPKDVRRELAWIAASAWGADKAYDRVWMLWAKGNLVVKGKE